MAKEGEMETRTALDPEERAYNTSTGTQWGSRRRARALCADGVVRTITVGIPDTFFSIPGHYRTAGRYVKGFVSVADWRDEEAQTIDGVREGDYIFTAFTNQNSR